MRNRFIKKIVLCAAVLLAGVFCVGNVQALSKQDVSINDCINGENTGWTSCPIIDSIRNSVESLYSWLLENWLAVNPKLLLFANPDDPGSSVFTAWRYFQTIADALLILYLIIVILSQITGVGISNYGIKKALPRIVLAAVLINLSYFICQAAVDLANIIGNGIFGFLNGLTVSSGIIADGQHDFGYSIALLAILALVVTVVVKLVVLNPAFINFAMMALISALIAVVFLFVVLGLRQVLTVLLVIISPLAILCSTFPGLRTLYQKWFNLFKGLLMAYPVCSVLIGGGALASQVLYDAWGGDSNFFAAVACMIICVAPFFFIPSITIKSVGALESVVNAVRGSKNRGGISGLAQKGYQNSDMSRRLERSGEKKRNYRRAGIATDLWGNAKRDENGNIIRKKNRKGQFKGDTHYLDTAMAQVEAEDRLRRYQQDPGMISRREDQDMVREYERLYRNNVTDPDKLIGHAAVPASGTNPGQSATGMMAAIEELNAARAGGDGMGERKALAKISAYGKLLASTREGQKAMSAQIQSFEANPIAHQGDIVRSMFSGMDTNDLNTLSLQAPRLGGYGREVLSQGYMNAGLYSNYGYNSSMFSNMTQDDFAALDSEYKQEIFAQATSGMFAADGSLQSGFSVEDNEFATNLARLVGTTSGSVDSMAKMSGMEQQWLNAFEGQRQQQIEAISATLQSGSITDAALKGQYATAASGGRGMEMEAIEMELRRRNIPNVESEIETLRRMAEATNNPNANASAANSRTRN